MQPILPQAIQVGLSGQYNQITQLTPHATQCGHHTMPSSFNPQSVHNHCCCNHHAPSHGGNTDMAASLAFANANATMCSNYTAFLMGLRR